jgi:hypothetical protein
VPTLDVSHNEAVGLDLEERALGDEVREPHDIQRALPSHGRHSIIMRGLREFAMLLNFTPRSSNVLAGKTALPSTVSPTCYSVNSCKSYSWESTIKVVDVRIWEDSLGFSNPSFKFTWILSFSQFIRFEKSLAPLKPRSNGICQLFFNQLSIKIQSKSCLLSLHPADAEWWQCKTKKLSSSKTASGRAMVLFMTKYCMSNPK